VAGAPDPKSRTLARGPSKYRRKVASPKQWAAIDAAKMGPCRVCLYRSNDPQRHHLVSRQDHGDDIADNIVFLCQPCHDAVTRRVATICRLLLSRLSDSEYAYMIERGGEDYPVRAYGIEYRR
jgi:hypothetical protein